MESLPKRRLIIRMDRELFLARAVTTPPSACGTVPAKLQLHVESFCLKSYTAALGGTDPWVIVAATNLFYAQSVAQMAWEGPEVKWDNRELLTEVNITPSAMTADRIVRAEMERAQKEGAT